jgi:hypothetical protein
MYLLNGEEMNIKRYKKVLVEATIKYEIEVPADWDGRMIEFSRNDGTWCASNIIEELKELNKKEDCLCSYVSYKFIKNVKRHK